MCFTTGALFAVLDGGGPCWPPRGERLFPASLQDSSLIPARPAVSLMACLFAWPGAGRPAYRARPSRSISAGRYVVCWRRLFFARGPECAQ